MSVPRPLQSHHAYEYTAHQSKCDADIDNHALLFFVWLTSHFQGAVQKDTWGLFSSLSHISFSFLCQISWALKNQIDGYLS